ncbi:MAG: hypothetical protein Q8M01_13855 [Rubrivivax sp.]|nr:hypothetical protein [Rubrivivax sp.]
MSVECSSHAAPALGFEVPLEMLAACRSNKWRRAYRRCWRRKT